MVVVRVGLLAMLAACSFRAPLPQMHADDAPVVDASVDDVPREGPFDPATECPMPAYATVLPGSTSRYRIEVATQAFFWPHEMSCNADLPGATHMIVFDTMDELVQLDMLLDATQTVTRYYVGGVQDPQAATRDAGWIAFDGTPLLPGVWYAPESEPDDGGDGIENQGQQLVILDTVATYFHDATGVSNYGVVCECDGKPVAAMARTFVDTDPNHPP